MKDTDGQQHAQLCKEKMAPIVTYLGKKKFLMGENITYLDFIFVELCDFVQFLSADTFFEENKSIVRYVKNIKGKKQIKNYVASTRFFDKPFNAKMAKINNL